MRVGLGAKVTLFLFCLIAALSSVGLYFVYRGMVSMKEQEIRGSLLLATELAAALIDGDLHEEIPLEPSGIQKPQYQQLRDRLVQVQKDHPFIRYIYTLAPDVKGQLCFVVDSASRQDFFTYPGTHYTLGNFDGRIEDILSVEILKQAVSNQWGDFLSGFAPIKNSIGETVALLGVDMSLELIQEAKRVLWHTFFYILLMTFLVSLLLGALAARWIVQPIRSLVRGTQIIANGDLTHQVPIDRGDEIGELAESFNKMVVSLSKSYRDVKRAFINAIKSLTVALEAKDPYTKGHALRVGRYSLMIAKEMHVPEDDLENLEALSAMHDIGKIGIRDSILLKPAPLNDEEKEVLRKHPEIGEEILRPLAYFEPELLKLIRSHHERPDGLGYPDGLKGDDIPLLVSIVAVADAYDAMVTNRPYRKGMPPEKAFEELHKWAGKQYDMRVIQALEKVIFGEKRHGN